MLWPKVDAELAGAGKQKALKLGRDQATRAAAFDRIGPPPNPRRVAPGNGRDGQITAA